MGISTFGTYRAKYPSRAPAYLGHNPEEHRLLDVADGVQHFSDAPCPVQTQDLNPSETQPDNEMRFLWVVRTPDVPFVRERDSVTPPVSSQARKHTNLTGGQDAHCGGEVWFVSDRRLIINGASGRYAPRDSAELDEISSAFEAAGYQVWSMGWDSEAARPARVVRGVPPW